MAYRINYPGHPFGLAVSSDAFETIEGVYGVGAEMNPFKCLDFLKEGSGKNPLELFYDGTWAMSFGDGAGREKSFCRPALLMRRGTLDRVSRSAKVEISSEPFRLWERVVDDKGQDVWPAPPEK